MIFFTADTHFNHGQNDKKHGIIKFCNRPFKGVVDMNKQLIRKWNERVKESDTVFHLGDFGFYMGKVKPKKYLDMLNGNITFIKGNHDWNNKLHVIMELAVIKYGGSRIKLMHDPKYADSNYEFNLCGHVHNEFKFKRTEDSTDDKPSYIINVGVDQWDFMPVTWNEIYSEFTKWLKPTG